MKYLIGIVVTIIILSLGLYFVLDLWNIELPITEEELKKGLITTAIVSFVFLILLILIPFFFKNHSKGYDSAKGNVAKPKK